MLNSCALHDSRIGCALLGHVSATLPRLSQERRPLPSQPPAAQDSCVHNLRLQPCSQPADQLGSGVRSGTIFVYEQAVMVSIIGSHLTAGLGVSKSRAGELKRSLLSCSPRSMSAPRMMLSAFESEWGTEFDAQSSLTVVYVTSKLYYDRLSRLGARESLQRSQCTRNVKIVINLPTYAWTLSVQL